MSATKKGKPLEQLIAILPHIAIFSPQTGEYADLREIYAQDNPAVPLAIARPKNGNEVAQIVTQAVNLQIPFAIRSGGHDSWGRTMVQDALTIDMRDIYHVEVAASKQSARVGGGILMGSLLNELGKHELVTTFGAVPTIGYVGWATLGGYGIVSSQYGIGVDQIIAAKIVNAEGKIVNASAEVLKGIRGAGGNFGAIVELEIKVYPLGKAMSGIIIYDPSDTAGQFKSFFRNLRHAQKHEFAPELGLIGLISSHPAMGRMFCCLFFWASSDFEKGERYHQMVRSFGNPVADTVISSTTAAQWVDTLGHVIPLRSNGRMCTANVREMTDDVLNRVVESLEDMPVDPATSLVVQEVRGPSTQDHGNTFFVNRERHFLLEIVGSVTRPELLEKGQTWSRGLHAKLVQEDAALKHSYIALSFPDDASQRAAYGSKWEDLVRLKKKYDPSGVFSLAMPKITKT